VPVGALARLFALAEAYPDLKANQNMMQLTEELTGTETKISFARQSFNDAVMSYNTSASSSPPMSSPARSRSVPPNCSRPPRAKKTSGR